MRLASSRLVRTCSRASSISSDLSLKVLSLVYSRRSSTKTILMASSRSSGIWAWPSRSISDESSLFIWTAATPIDLIFSWAVHPTPTGASNGSFGVRRRWLLPSRHGSQNVGPARAALRSNCKLFDIIPVVEPLVEKRTQ